MFQTAGYPVHPPYFSNFDYRSPPQTPPQAGGQTYYSPRHYSTPQSKGHSRRATGDGTTYTYTRTYSTPQKPAHYSSPEYSSQQYYSSARSTPQRKSDYVPIYTAAEPAEKKRPRRASYSTKPTHPTTPRRPSTATKPSPPKATEEDARRAGIPHGYSYKNWDPTEEPILLLGSVFDANSLGKWIYDWTVFYHGAATPMTEIAGELWLLLIQLAGKVKRAEEVMGRIRRSQDRDLVEDFLDAGERLWQRFNKLLKTCEDYMWRAAKKESSRSEKVTMGRNSGCEFVGSIFGRDRELEVTEKLMTNMRLWSWRFDQNLDDILRNPAA